MKSELRRKDLNVSEPELLPDIEDLCSPLFIERLGLLFIRLLMLTTILVPAVIYCLVTWEHYMTPKMLTFRVLAIGMFCMWFVFRKQLGGLKSPFLLPSLFYVFFCLLSTFRATTMFEAFGSEYLPHIIILSFFVIIVGKMLMGNKRLLWMVLAITTLVGLATGVYGIWQVYGVDPIIGKKLVDSGQGPVSFMGNTNFAAYYLILALPLIWMMISTERGGARFNLILPPLFVVSMVFGYHRFTWALIITIIGGILLIAASFTTKNIPKTLCLSLTTVIMTSYLGFTQNRYAIIGFILGIGAMALVGAHYRFVPWMYFAVRGERKKLLGLIGPIALSIFLALLLGALGMLNIKYRRNTPENISLFIHASAFLATAGLLALTAWSFMGTYGVAGFKVSKETSGKVLVDSEETRSLRREHIRDLRKRIWFVTCTILGAIILVTLILSPKIMAKIEEVPSFVFRMEVWRSAGRNIIDNFFFGIGAGNFKVIHPIYTTNLENTVLGVEKLARKVHNDYMAIWVEYGLGAIVAFFWFLVLIWQMMFKGLQRIDITRVNRQWFDHQDSRFYTYLIIGTIGAFVGTMFQANGASNFLQPASSIQIWFYAGMVASIYLYLRRNGGSHLDEFESL